jgi:uncharacterized membrane protein
MDLVAATTVRTTPEELFGFWRQLENLPRFMAHLDEVTATGDRTSRWIADTAEWDAEIVADVLAERIEWRSAPDAEVINAGVVDMTPAPDGVSTEVRVRLTYEGPGEHLFGSDPQQELEDDLRRLKQVIETGEVVRSDGRPWFRHGDRDFPQRPAQPVPADELAKEAQR